MLDQRTKTFGSTIKAIGAFSVLLALFMAGWTISANLWSSSNATLQTDLSHTRDELLRAKDEAAQAQQALAVSKADFSSKLSRSFESVSNADLSTEPSHFASSGGVSGGLAGVSNFGSITQQVVSVSAGQTESLFGGEIFISLVGTTFTTAADPIRHTVNASIGSAGFPNVLIEQQNVGFVTNYTAKNKFEVRVSSANTFAASFIVTRLDSNK